MSEVSLALKLGKNILREIIKAADAEGVEIHDIVMSTLNEKFLDNKIVELSDVEVDDLINKMIVYAYENIEPGQQFKANELYLSTFGTPWTQLSPSTRKSLGRRFRGTTNEQWDNAAEGELVIEHRGKNINNAAFYSLVNKVDL